MGAEKVLVVGATGRTGAFAVRQLAAKNFAVRAFARSAAKASSTLGPAASNVEIVEGVSQNAADVAKAMSGAKYVVCAQGGSGWDFFGSNSSYDVEYVGLKTLVDAAKAARVEKFVLVSTLAITRPSSFIYILLNSLMGRVMHWKSEGEAYLRKSGVPYVIVRPGGLTMEPSQGLPALVLDQGDKINGRVSREDVALACVEALASCPPGTTFELVQRAPDAPPAAPPASWAAAFASLRRD
eukprot:tig00000478_g1276.t1